MTPKEKANKLYESMFYKLNDSKGMFIDINLKDECAKSCALIAVDEMIAELAYIRTHYEEFNELIDFEIDQRQDFLIEVEKEIKAI